MNFSFFVAMGLVLWVGGNKVIAGEMSVGTLAEFLTFMTILQMPVRQLGLMVNSFARASTCGERLFAFSTSSSRSRTRPAPSRLKVTEGTLRFEDVDFTYPGADAIRCCTDISFEAQARPDHRHRRRRRAAASRRIAHLIPRFYDVDGGAHHHRRAGRRAT